MKKKLYRVLTKIMMNLDPAKAAKMMGVNIRGGVRMSKNIHFGTEPWLITIEDGTLITDGVRFLTHDGSVNTLRKLDEKYSRVQKFGKIYIKENAFIGNEAYIMPNVTIGKNAIVGARSVVTKDVPDNMVVAGVPAKIICTVDELAEKFLANTPEYSDWHSKKEKMKTSAMIADYWKNKGQKVAL